MQEYRQKKRTDKARTGEQRGRPDGKQRDKADGEQRERLERVNNTLDQADVRQVRMLDAVGVSLEDLEYHDSVLGRMKALGRATTLAQAACRAQLCPRGAHWDKRVDELEKLLDHWRRKWDKRVDELEKLLDHWRRKWEGMAHWAERRHMMETGLLVEEEIREYEQHVEYGITILNGSQMLFSWGEGVGIPEDLALVISLYRRSINIAIEVSTGLERLSIYKYQQGL
jgi:hypothetical protein